MEKHSQLLSIVLLCFALLCGVIYIRLVRSPSNFPTHTVVSITPGETLNDVTRELRNDGIIRSSVTFQSIAILFGGERRIIAGDYLLSTPENAITLAWRVSHGDFGMEETKITVPEGFTNTQIGDLLQAKFLTFDETQFLLDARQEQGYLFPDTYFFPPTATSSDIISRMKENFDAKIAPFLPAIAISTHTEADIITMASILEQEATSTTDRKIVAGILWNRIRAGVPLEVDSSVAYAAGKLLKDVTAADINIHSPYNTYEHTGLPPGPLDNPGLDSISAALFPIQTKYVYFLTGSDGIMHYATTFAQHEANIAKYLK
jgi:UPF0755 protein